MHRSIPTLVVAALALACASDPAGSAGDGSTGGSSTSGSGSASASTSGSGTSSTSTSGSGTSSTGSSGSGAASTSASGSGGDSGTGGAGAGCPEPLPQGWIFCEDFETLTDPGDRFFEYDDGSGRFVLASDEAASGTRSMRATYEPGVNDAGWINVAFGENPIVYGNKPHYEPNATYTEIWWRLKLRMEPGWPDVGPFKVTRATVFAKPNWGQAMIAHLWSAGAEVTLLGDPASCVSGGTVNCNTYNDFANLQWLGQMNGTTELFSSALSGQWHCIEGHVRLNTPGQADGVFEFWIDGNLENARSDLDWRGTYTEYGLNLVSFENYWNGGPPKVLQRWMDDVAVATVPIGCD